MVKKKPNIKLSLNFLYTEWLVKYFFLYCPPAENLSGIGLLNCNLMCCYFIPQPFVSPQPKVLSGPSITDRLT